MGDESTERPAGPRARAIYLGLGALLAHTFRVGPSPTPPPFEVRAILAALHALSPAADRDPFDSYWRDAIAPLPANWSAEQQRYVRSTNMRSSWSRICTALGANLLPADESRLLRLAQGRRPD